MLYYIILLSPTSFNLKLCEVAKNIRFIHVNIGLCVRFVALPHVANTERFNISLCPNT